MKKVKTVLRRTVQEFIRSRGYYLCHRQKLPHNLDLFSDLERLTVQPRVIFDVGANQGKMSRAFAKHFPSSTIYAFEPVKESFEELVKTTAGGNVVAIQAGVGAKGGFMAINVPDNTEYASLVYLKPGNCRRQIVAITTLDDFCQERQIQEIDLLKIDTEGFEAQVLHGAKDLLSQGRIKAIFAECSLKPDGRHTHFLEIDPLLPEFSLLGFYDLRIKWNLPKVAFCNGLWVLPGASVGL